VIGPSWYPGPAPGADIPPRAPIAWALNRVRPEPVDPLNESTQLAWYDFFSRFYDSSLERLYAPHRAAAAEAIDAKPLRAVVDLACGTGQNFPHLMKRLASGGGHLVGVDASPGMLARAHARTLREGWTNVSLVEADARQVDAPELFGASGSVQTIDCVICALGLSVMPDWQSVFTRSFQWLRPGGQYVILDVFARERSLQTHWVEWLARADLTRRVWEPLEERGVRFERRVLDASPRIFGGELFLAVGVKPDR